jgi:hypothetical protein
VNEAEAKQQEVLVTVRREYRLSVYDLFPDGVPEQVRGYAGFPSDWSLARRAAFVLNNVFSTNPFEPSSFLKDFDDRCSDESAHATALS